jgi:hypothetical protein
MDAHGSAGDAGGDYLTSEQREFARLKQERVDAEYAKQIDDEAAATHVVSSNPRSSELGSARESSACPSPREAPYDMQHSGPCQRAAEFEEIDVRGSKSPRGSYQALPGGDDGRGPELPKQPTMRKLPLPTLDTFACCISLRFGAVMIICCDLVSATFRALASFIVLTFPQLALEAEDETLFVGDVMQERAKRFLLREMRVRFFLSVMMVYFSVRGWKAVQTVEAEGSPLPFSSTTPIFVSVYYYICVLILLCVSVSVSVSVRVRVSVSVGLREYLNWKVFDTAMYGVMGVMLHRLWWEGCGYLPRETCWDLRYNYMTNTFLSTLVRVSCVFCVCVFVCS